MEFTSNPKNHNQGIIKFDAFERKTIYGAFLQYLLAAARDRIPQDKATKHKIDIGEVLINHIAFATEDVTVILFRSQPQLIAGVIREYAIHDNHKHFLEVKKFANALDAVTEQMTDIAVDAQMSSIETQNFFEGLC